MAPLERAPLFVIPVRGGSKGLRGKNLRPVGGVSLVGRAVRTALAARDRIGGGTVVVDSDCEDLLSEALRWDVDVASRRPPELARDETPTMETLRHLLRRLDAVASPRTVVLMQATSPLTTVEHVVEALRLHSETLSPVVSVQRGRHPLAWALRMESGRLVSAFDLPLGTRRQDVGTHFELTGAVYVASSEDLLGGQAFLELGRSVPVFADDHHPVDIDDAADLALAESIVRAMPTRSLRVGEHFVGDDGPLFVAARVTENTRHSGGRAAGLAEIARAGARAVFFETLGSQDAHFADGDEARRLGLAVVWSLSDEAIAFGGSAVLPDALHLVGADALPKVGFRDGRGCALPILFEPRTLELPAIERAMRGFRRLGHEAVALLVRTPSDARLAEVAREVARLRRAFHVPVAVVEEGSGASAAVALASGACGWIGSTSLDEGAAGAAMRRAYADQVGPIGMPPDELVRERSGEGRQ